MSNSFATRETYREVLYVFYDKWNRRCYYRTRQKVIERIPMQIPQQQQQRLPRGSETLIDRAGRLIGKVVGGIID